MSFRRPTAAALRVVVVEAHAAYNASSGRPRQSTRVAHSKVAPPKSSNMPSSVVENLIDLGHVPDATDVVGLDDAITIAFELSSSDPALESLRAPVVLGAARCARLRQANPDELWTLVVQVLSPPILMTKE